MNRMQIRFAGAGGQGAITAGEILVVAAIRSGLHAIGTPMYTSQVRGGPTLSEVILDSDEIYFPKTVFGEIDFMIATADISYHKYKDAVRHGATIVIDPNLVHPTGDDRRLWTFVEIPIVEIAKREVGKIETQSAVALAVAVAFTNCVPKDAAIDAMISRVPSKYAEHNRKAFALGVQYAEANKK